MINRPKQTYASEEAHFRSITTKHRYQHSHWNAQSKQPHPSNTWTPLAQTSYRTQHQHRNEYHPRKNSTYALEQRRFKSIVNKYRQSARLHPTYAQEEKRFKAIIHRYRQFPTPHPTYAQEERRFKSIVNKHRQQMDRCRPQTDHRTVYDHEQLTSTATYMTYQHTPQPHSYRPHQR